MSTTMETFCEIHKEEGPRIHRNAGGAVGIWPAKGGDIFDNDQAMSEWNRWIILHEYCDFVVRAQT